MRAFFLSFSSTTIYALLAAFSSAIPLDASPSLSPRRNYCDNAPTTIAGTPLSPRALPPRALLPPRKSTNTIRWCAPLSSTYVILQLTAPGPGPALLAALSAASAFALAQISKRGDGPVPGGKFFFAATVGAGAGLDVETWNTNNHQQTWGVLGAALAAVRDYMHSSGSWGEVAFTIFDGGHEVGQGTVS